MRTLQSYVEGRWQAPTGGGVEVRDAATGEPVAVVSSEGVDMGVALDHARRVGGPALRGQPAGCESGHGRITAHVLTLGRTVPWCATT